jgi:hypothetical protein
VAETPSRKEPRNKRFSNNGRRVKMLNANLKEDINIGKAEEAEELEWSPSGLTKR